MNDATKFLVLCGLTCMGGSEKKGCPCTHPRDCAMREHPDFETQRRSAGERLMRCAMNEAEARRERTIEWYTSARARDAQERES